MSQPRPVQTTLAGLRDRTMVTIFVFEEDKKVLVSLVSHGFRIYDAQRETVTLKICWLFATRCYGQTICYRMTAFPGRAYKH